LLGGCVILVACAGLAVLASRQRTAGPTAEKAAEPAAESMGKRGAFELIFNDRYLMLIAALTVLLNVVNTSGEYLFGRYILEQANLTLGTGPAQAAAREQFVGAQYSWLFSTVNLVGLVIQLFVVSRVLKWLGIGKSLFVHPIVALAGYLMLLWAPSLQLMGLLKVADNSLDYSLGNTTKQGLWLNTSRESKYKAKQAVDSFFVRGGDVLQAGLVFAGEKLALSVPAFAAVIISLTGLWLTVVALLNKALSRQDEAADKVA
jgi:AAA family ATP:ADP antiporter